MKKLIAVLLALVVLSPMVFAQETAEPNRLRKRINVENGTPEPMQIRERLKENLSGLRERFQERREISKEEVEKARERYKTAKEKYQNARGRYQTARQNVVQTKAVVDKCEDSETEECVKAERQIKQHSKSFLENTVDSIISMLEKLRAKVESNEDLSEEEAEKMLADIDAKIESLKEARESAEDINENSSKEEIRESTQEIKQAWKETRTVAKQNTGRLVNEKIGGIVVQIEQVRVKLDRIIEKLKSEGYEIEGIEAIYADFDDELGKARENYEKARELHQQDVASGEVDEVMKQANEHMRQARQHLQNTHRMLKNLVFNIKGLQNGQRILETPEVEEKIEENEIEEEVEIDNEVYKEDLLEEETEDEEKCEEGETETYTCPDGKEVFHCGCENNKFVCIISPEAQCEEETSTVVIVGSGE